MFQSATFVAASTKSLASTRKRDTLRATGLRGERRRSMRSLLCGIVCVAACTYSKPDVTQRSAAVTALQAPLLPQAPLLAAAPLTPLALADIGPSVTTGSQLYPWTGRVVSASINPGNDQVALVASDRSGLWRTADG